MATQIQMPKLGLTMQEGKVAEWVVPTGTHVTKGTVVMLIETDKVEAEVEAEGDGLVSHAAAVGDVLEPGEVVGWLLAEGEEAPAGEPAAAPPAAAPAEAADTVPDPAPAAAAPAAPVPPARTGRLLASPAAKRLAGERGINLELLVGTGPDGRIVLADVDAAPPAAGGRIKASPAAKRVAKERGVDLTTVVGSGPGGRIVLADVPAQGTPASASAPASAPAASAPAERRFVPFVAAKAAQKLGVNIASVAGSGPDGRVTRQDVFNHAQSLVGSGPAPRTARAAAPAGPQPGDVVPVSGMRGIIADRMHSSLQEMAQLTLSMDVEMDRVVALRKQLSEIGAEELGAVPGYTDFVIAACAHALQRHPMVNAQMNGNQIDVLTEINVGMAVAVDDGLMVPVVHGTDQLGLADLAVETSRLAAAARDKKLSLQEMEGGTFSVTALGMFGVDMFTPVINPPNAAILGVGRIRDDVGWNGDTPAKVKRMTISLTWDHRVLDGAPAAEFAQSVKELLEQPLRLL